MKNIIFNWSEWRDLNPRPLHPQPFVRNRQLLSLSGENRVFATGYHESIICRFSVSNTKHAVLMAIYVATLIPTPTNSVDWRKSVRSMENNYTTRATLVKLFRPARHSVDTREKRFPFDFDITPHQTQVR